MREDLPLPAAILKRSAVAHNSDWMRRFLALSGAQLCPHGKTTMAPQLFHQQLDDGAWGITLRITDLNGDPAHGLTFGYTPQTEDASAKAPLPPTKDLVFIHVDGEHDDLQGWPQYLELCHAIGEVLDLCVLRK